MKEDSTKQRVAVIEYKLCQPEACGNFLCIRVCPVNKMGKECIKKNIEEKPEIDENLCTGCGICQKKCPFEAIHIINISTKLGKPIHQYGKNAFRLYRLPLPKEGFVVGIIGKNGVGKSTALKIISGILIPNLGNYEEKENIEKVLEYYRGNEIYKLFEKIKNKEIKISYKPQNVEIIPKYYKGRVIDILEKHDREKVDRIIEQLNIKDYLDRLLENLSGGELQKLAIALCILKDAELYAFDEPSSYLDIYERMRIAKQIRELAEKGKSVIVIEHDLALLDYLSDYVHVVFGKPSAYGVFSTIKNSKNGINEYLDGFLKDENLRFRSEEIKFDVVAPNIVENRKIFTTYPEMRKNYENFRLVVEAGEIKKGEVLGIFGPNAIGKTTFIKMLAGVEKPDNVNLEWRYKIAYKPQYLTIDENILVREFLDKSNIDKEFFNMWFEKKLDLKKLLDCKLSELSGGELQKVSVAATICKDSDIILLDEPSAYVDIEDRLIMAEVIRKAAEVKEKPIIVVDHDIIFVDCVSERIIVFEGKPAFEGRATRALEKREGMNKFLGNMQITMRREKTTGRPRINKLNSQLDQEQKKEGKYYYLY
ncbi:MAG: ribosome biogenesis/translation initiation ATPase RLI [Candidatus Diapherotrites archaeon]|nr:ribosome biogenesis/translation initiation ATPase RLI [Candidatus Diapherotrites archaeon]